jgi:hypothetical protein
LTKIVTGPDFADWKLARGLGTAADKYLSAFARNRIDPEMANTIFHPGPYG